MPVELSELTLCRAWREGWHARELRTTDGCRLSVVYPGVWTNSDGPDFRDAMLDVNGRLLRGAVEVHLRSSGWLQHGHQYDPAYDDVVLHAVLEDDLGDAVLTRSGQVPLTLELDRFLSGSLEELVGQAMLRQMDALGTTTCLPTLAGGRAEEVRAVLWRKGWERLAARELRFRQSFEVSTPDQVLYAGLLDALGFSRNRAGMARVAERMPLVLLEAIAGEQGWIGAAAALLGVAGFLPLAPAHQELCAVTPQAADHISWSFEHLRGGNQLTPIDPTEWTLNRARPANHPARRLASLATLVVEAAPDGLLARVLALELSSPLSCDAWLKQAVPALGGDRRAAIATNVVAPFLAAYADVSGDEELSQCVATFWEQLPGQVSDATARRALRQIAGAARLPIRLALEEQGLHQIGRFGCAPLRCFECPIADLAARYEQWS